MAGGTAGGLLFAEEFVKVLKEADDDDEQGACASNEKEPGNHCQKAMEESGHRGIVNQGWSGQGWDG
jgi:hypothetical protein